MRGDVDVIQAVEIALGDTLGGKMGQKRSIARTTIHRQMELLQRTLRELPPDLTVHELLEELNDD